LRIGIGRGKIKKAVRKNRDDQLDQCGLHRQKTETGAKTEAALVRAALTEDRDKGENRSCIQLQHNVVDCREVMKGRKEEAGYVKRENNNSNGRL
jgi:hypothetical protein